MIEQNPAPDRAFIARAVKRRKADHRLADDLRARGWVCTAPEDELEKRIKRAALTSRVSRASRSA